VAIGGYSINGYWWLLVAILLMAIDDYLWLLVTILLTLLVNILLMVISGYFINGY